MPIRTNGSAGALQNVTGDLEYYTVYVSSPLAATNPENASGINIAVTGDIKDESQKNFEVLLQSIGLRAMPTIMNEPKPTADLAFIGAPTMGGEGYVWKFAVELKNVFKNYGPSGTIGDVGFLIDELDGIVLPNSEVLRTKTSINIEFVKTTGL